MTVTVSKYKLITELSINYVGCKYGIYGYVNVLDEVLSINYVGCKYRFIRDRLEKDPGWALTMWDVNT